MAVNSRYEHWTAWIDGCYPQLTAKPLVLGLQVVDLSLKGWAVGTLDRLHTSIIWQQRDVQRRRR